jgi:hypothetical protein
MLSLCKIVIFILMLLPDHHGLSRERNHFRPVLDLGPLKLGFASPQSRSAASDARRCSWRQCSRCRFSRHHCHTSSRWRYCRQILQKKTHMFKGLSQKYNFAYVYKSDSAYESVSDDKSVYYLRQRCPTSKFWNNVCLNDQCNGCQLQNSIPIRGLSAHSAAKFNISPGRWQQVWLVAIVPTKRWGEMDWRDCHTAWGDFKKLIYSLHHHKNDAGSFSLIGGFLSFFLGIAIYRLQVTTFLTQEWVSIRRECKSYIKLYTKL